MPHLGSAVLRVSLLAIMTVTFIFPSPTTAAAIDNNTTECHFRALTYAVALARQPWRAPLRDVFDALELSATCGVTPPPRPPPPAPPSFTIPPSAVFADAVHGADSNPGTQQAPVRSGTHDNKRELKTSEIILLFSDDDLHNPITPPPSHVHCIMRTWFSLPASLLNPITPPSHVRLGSACLLFP